EVLLDVDQRGEGAEHHCLILGDQDADHARAPCAVPRGGRVTSRRVPGSPERSSVPATCRRRSRIPDRPLPSGAIPPHPSSLTSSTARPFFDRRLIQQCCAPAWRMTLVTASRNAKASTRSSSA